MDFNALIDGAEGAVVKELVAQAVKGGVQGVGKFWGWLKSKATAKLPDAPPTVAAIEAAPEKPSTPDKVRGLLKDLLQDDPALQAELAALLKEAGLGTSVQQTAIGNHGPVNQIVGSGNQIR